MKLEWSEFATGLVFRVPGSPPERWALESVKTRDGRPARVGCLLRLLGDQKAKIEGADSVFVQHEEIVRFSDFEHIGLGLPNRAAVTLSMKGRGGIQDSDFHFELSLQQAGGRPLATWERRGSLLAAAGETWTLPASLFDILEAIQSFESIPAHDLDGRFRGWAAIRSLVSTQSDQISVDHGLDQVRVATANAFGLRPFINSRGEADFDPEPLMVTHSITADEVSQISRPALQGARQDDFAKAFRARKQSQPRYVAGDGWYVVVPAQLQKALGVVRKYQCESETVRREFLKAPRAFIRKELDDAVDEQVLEMLFSEEGFSDRVAKIGLRKPKVVPWLVRSGASWLPPDEVGLVVGDELVRFPKKDLPALKMAVEEAIAGGKPALEFNGRLIPADADTKSAIEELAGEATPSRPPTPPKDGKQADAAKPKKSPRERIAFLVKDNLEALEFSGSVRPRKLSRDVVSPRLQAALLPHQLEALEWLEEHFALGGHGVLLADDMGLGKTLTTLAFLAWLRDAQDSEIIPKKPLLILAPTGLLKNWKAEADKWLRPPGLGFLLEGYGAGLRSIRTAPTADREAQTGLPVVDLRQLSEADWVMTTYETMRDYQLSFGRIEWGCVAFDEVQKIKNPEAAMTDAAKALNADFRIALTGTPIENRLADLWCIVDAVLPGRLGALKEFVRVYESEGEEALQARRDLKRSLSEEPPPPMKRRLKEERLKGLPVRNTAVRPIEMPPVQKAAYDYFVERGRQRGQTPTSILEILGGFRSASLHPAPTESEDEVFVRSSARLIATLEILDAVAKASEKALVFVDALWMQSRLVELLQRRYELESPPLTISGEVDGTIRKDRVDDFQARSGFDVMLLSPRAGGVGLTITAANHVIHLSRWWNPAVEDQCNDRAYRIGQKKPVTIYVPQAIHPVLREHSFDLKLHELLEHKRRLSRDLLAPPRSNQFETNQFFNDLV